jgi:hypothetical protein
MLWHDRLERIEGCLLWRAADPLNFSPLMTGNGDAPPAGPNGEDAPGTDIEVGA